MSEREFRQGKVSASCESEWMEIIDRIENAIMLSVANKVLENAAMSEEKYEENIQKDKLVELRRFSRKKQVNPPSRSAC